MVNRVTILTDRIGNAKGYAYIEFEKADAAVSAVLLDGTELRGRQIKVKCSVCALALHLACEWSCLHTHHQCICFEHSKTVPPIQQHASQGYDACEASLGLPGEPLLHAWT